VLKFPFPLCPVTFNSPTLKTLLYLARPGHLAFLGTVWMQSFVLLYMQIQK
jgi:hypothetical protein